MDDYARFLDKRLVVDAARIDALRNRLGLEAERLSRGPRLLFSGQAAASAVARLLPTANPLTVQSGLGPVELQPGTIWSDNRLLVSADTTFTHYTIGDGFYEWSTSSFIREEWFNAVAPAVAQAELIVTLAKVEIAFITGLLVPFYQLLLVSAASLGLSFHRNRETYMAALDQAPRVIQLLNDFRERCPTLYTRLRNTAANDLLANLPSGVTAEDVAFFLGRIIRTRVIGTILRTVLIGMVVALSRLGLIAGRALRQSALDRVSELQSILATQGVPVTRDEAERIIREIEAMPDTPKKLQELQQAIEKLLPLLEGINRALTRQ